MGLYNISMDCGCCVGLVDTYRVLSFTHHARGNECRQFSGGAPQLQYGIAKGIAESVYEGGAANQLLAPGPCEVPEGWRKSSAYFSTVVQIGGGASDTIISGSTPVFGYYFVPEPPPFDGGYGNALHGGPVDFPTQEYFAHRLIGGHVTRGGGGMYIAGGTSPYGLMQKSCAGASLATSVWVFIVPVTGSNSLQGQWGYNSLRFKLKINQRGVSAPTRKFDIPQDLLKYAEWNQTTLAWEEIEASQVNTEGTKIVIGNAGGGLFADNAGPLTDNRSAEYWIAKHLINGDYDESVTLPTLPRDVSEAILDVATNPATGQTTYGGFYSGSSTVGLSTTTQITDPDEIQYGVPHGMVWYMAIIPDGDALCMESNLPEDLSRTRDGGGFQSWFNQMWGGDTMTSLNVVKLEGFKSTGGPVVLVPNNGQLLLNPPPPGGGGGLAGPGLF